MEDQKKPAPPAEETSFGDGSTDLANLTEEQWTEWEKTGELPKAGKTAEKETPKEEEPAKESPAPEQENDEAAETDDKSKSDPSNDTHRQERKPTKQPESERRIKELLGRVKELEDENSKLKPKEVKAEPAKRVKPTMQDKNADGTPKYPATDAGFENYTDDVIEWREQERDAKKAAEKVEADKKASEAKVAELKKQQEESWKVRAEEAKKEHEDFEAVAYDKDTPIIPNSIPDQWMLRSPKGAELLYYFGTHKDELKRINKLGPDDQLRELVKLEDKLDPPATNKITKASKPPSEVGGRGAAAADAVKAAVENEDYEAFKEAEDAREIARRGGKRR